MQYLSTWPFEYPLKDHKNVYRWIEIYIVIPIFITLIFLYSIFISDISTCVNAISKTRLWILAFSFVYVLWASSHDKCFILNSRNYLLVLKPHVSFAEWMFTRFKCRIMTYFKMYSMCNFNIILSWKTKKGWRRIILSSTKSNILFSSISYV